MQYSFGILQNRFEVVHRPNMYFHREVLKDNMYACIILRSIIVKDKRHLYLNVDQFIYNQMDNTPHKPFSQDHIFEFVKFIDQPHHIRDKMTRSPLQVHLIGGGLWSPTLGPVPVR